MQLASSLQLRARPLQPARQLRSYGAAPLRRKLIVAAATGGNDNDARLAVQKDKKIQEYVSALEKGGLRKDVAQEVLKKWEEAGADGGDPGALRKLFLKQSAVPALATSIQTLFDGAAAYSIFTSAVFFAAGPPFAGRDVLVFALNALSAYFAVGVVLDLATLTTIVISTVKVGTSIDSFYAALKSYAGEATGLRVLDQAKAVANAVKVAQALDAISQMLETAPSADAKGTLSSLSAYLTLQRSEARDGFDPAKLGMTEAEASDLALRFAQYDLNDDGRLDAGEVRAMAGKLGIELAAVEAEAAIQAMDKNTDGLIEFSEWAAWWAERRKK